MYYIVYKLYYIKVCHVYPIHSRVYVFSSLFIYLFIWLIKRYQSYSSKIPKINNVSHIFDWTQISKNLIEVMSWNFCNTLLKIHLCTLAIYLFLCSSNTKTCGCISVQANTCYMHRTCHPPTRSRVQTCC